MLQDKRPSPSREELIAQLRNALDRTPAKEAYLFGSWSKGTADSYSDLDLVVVYDTERPFFERFRDFDPLYHLGRAIDLLIYRPDEFQKMQKEGNPFIEHVLETGTRVL